MGFPSYSSPAACLISGFEAGVLPSAFDPPPHARPLRTPFVPEEAASSAADTIALNAIGAERSDSSHRVPRATLSEILKTKPHFLLGAPD
jgi:hypothetical protein